MKNKRWLLAILVIGFFCIATIINFNKTVDLVYIKEDSSLNEFYFEDDYVIFDCNIKIKNNTSKNHYFDMQADVSNEVGLTKEKIATGYEEQTNKDTFFIKGGSEMVYEVKFKVLKGEKIEKTNRLPPDDIFIRIK